MARIPRDDTAANDLAAKLGELGSSLNKIFQEEANRLRDSFNAEEFKVSKRLKIFKILKIENV